MSDDKFIRLYILRVEDRNGMIHTFMENSISFSVNKNLRGQINDGHITIKNLSEETRNLLLKDMVYDKTKLNVKIKRKCELSTGYKGRPLNVIMRGEIFSCCSTRNGVDIDVKIHVAEGLDLYENGRPQKCFAKGAKKDDVVKVYAEEAEKYGILRGQIDAFNDVIPNALTIDKDFKNCKIDGCYMFIDDGKINIIKENSALETNTLLINNESGLLEIPLRYDGFVEVKMIMESGATLGQPVKLEAEIDKHFNGNYAIQGIKHEGTISFQGGGGGECVTTLELQKLEIEN
jgi:hypothetical protein